MKTILKYIIASAVATASLSGCIKETFPTNGATADQVAESTTALDAMVNAIPGALTLYAQNYSQAWDFGYPAINVSLTCMTGDMVVLGNTGYDWFANWMCNLYLSEDYVLRDYPHHFALFVCADDAFREARGKTVYDGKSLKELDAENAKRARYYNYYTGRTWGDGRNYDLVVNTSKEPLEKIADAIVSYIKTVRA